MIKIHEYRIYPDQEQESTLDYWLSICRTLYNQALAWKNSHYKQTGENINLGKQGKSLTQLRSESDDWQSIPVDILQDALRRLDKAYQAFYRRAQRGEKPGFPRFKGEGRYRSISFAHVSKRLIRQIGGRLARISVPKLGLIKIRYHRPLPEGRIKGFSINRKASGWYIAITIEVNDPIEKIPKTAIGIDVGLSAFYTTSQGEKVEPPKFFRQSEDRLAKAQRRHAKKKKGSYRRRKLKEQIAKIHEHIANQRKDFHFKQVVDLFRKADLIAIEDLAVKNMIRNKKLSKSIADVGWGNFRSKLESKAASAGLHVEAVNPKQTTQECSSCGVIVKKDLSERIHDCPDCGLRLDRDHNAAINILRAALAQRGEDSKTRFVGQALVETRNQKLKQSAYMPNALTFGS